MNSKRVAGASAQRAGENLDRRYGKIGISAVVAALPYQSATKNPAYAPAQPSSSDQSWRWELAA